MRSFDVRDEVWEGRKADDTADLCVYLLRCVLHNSSVVEKRQLIVFSSFFRVAGEWVNDMKINISGNTPRESCETKRVCQ